MSLKKKEKKERISIVISDKSPQNYGDLYFNNDNRATNALKLNESLRSIIYSNDKWLLEYGNHFCMICPHLITFKKKKKRNDNLS